ncbi:uncharacterized protein LOC133180685 [Saccostrea echinata]|uniref:uncharacterized protein LOC133180685 n=1 Tax=Saccostrea echinata TaxID=191078 RepID=UPI002A830794|nr:uncharacterized protein LOC133180685 [Saccostrea echinata]
MGSGSSAQCKVRQCSQCQLDTEFYCNTCKHDLCLQCKERHVIDLDTMYHDVVVFREKHDYIQKQETCVRHTDKSYRKYCQSCELPVCVKCIGHRKHKILDIRLAYEANLRRCKEILNIIRNESLYNSCFLLTEIKTDRKTFCKEISNGQNKMSTKAQRLKDCIDTAICDVKFGRKRFIYRLQRQIRIMNRHLGMLENYEHRYEHSANRPVEFFLFLKKMCFHRKADTNNLPKHALLPLCEKINTDDVITLLGRIQLIETRKREVKDECLLKLISTPVLHRTVGVTGTRAITHISHVTSDQIWISDKNNLILTNIEGDELHRLTDICRYNWSCGLHTVNTTGDLIYIDEGYNIKKLSKDNRLKSSMVKTKPWVPRCVYWSPSTGDLLVAMFNSDTKTAQLNRYNNKQEHIQTIQHDHTGQELYKGPVYITENSNGDVIVSDYYRGVVVTDYEGRYRFTYTGPPSGSRLYPQGACTNSLSHILVCDWYTNTVQMIDKEGHFLTLIQTQQQDIHRPRSLSYDDKTRLLWVGSGSDNTIYAYRCIERKLSDNKLYLN